MRREMIVRRVENGFICQETEGAGDRFPRRSFVATDIDHLVGVVVGWARGRDEMVLNAKAEAPRDGRNDP